MRKKILHLSFALVFFIFFLFTMKRYEKIEKDEQRLITDGCILSSISLILIGYYDEYKKYPDQNVVGKLILEAGYPNGLGCGPTSIKNADSIVDSSGNKLIYEYKSSSSVKFYFYKTNTNGYIVYELLNNQVTKRTKTPTNKRTVIK
ncbi:hypothetical protein [Microbulbifer sp.]|uniref:hypothetical protein n=1 Tax=Microbulbifer sp. TaxID=1908541 RepID=UPI003F37A80E